MISITVNGRQRTREEPVSVADLVADLTGIRVSADGAIAEGTTLGIAVAVNSAVVPRTGWTAHPLADGDAIEVVTATQGG